MEKTITLLEWFVVIMMADIVAAFVIDGIRSYRKKPVVRKKRNKPKRKKIAEVVPLRREG